jgi:Restriction endonuclease
MRITAALIQNGTVRGGRTPPARDAKTNMALAAFITLAVAMAWASLNEPSMFARVTLFLLAALFAGAPFVFLAIATDRDRREQIAEQTAQGRRQRQTRREITRAVEAKLEVLRTQIAANDDPDAWRAAVTRFAKDHVFPAISHAIPGSEREMWMMEITAIVRGLSPQPVGETVAEATAFETAATFTDACVQLIGSAGWDTQTTDDGVFAVSGDARVFFQCLSADAPIEEAAVEAFLARLSNSGAARGAIVSEQSYSPAALQKARALGVGLIRQDLIAPFLEWSARPANVAGRTAFSAAGPSR